MKYEDLYYKPGLIHIPGTKTENADREIELSSNDIKFIKQSIEKHPRRIDGKIFDLSHNAVSKTFNKAKENLILIAK